MSKAESTRQRLQGEAIRLFTERGFDSVTVEEVASAAGVSHMTFFRNFPTKESVVLDDPYDPLVAESVAATDPTLRPLERVRRGLLAAWAAVDEPGDTFTRQRIELAASHPALRARIWENNQRTEEAIVSSLVDSGAEQLEARVAAGAVLGAITAALLDWAEDDRLVPLGERVRTAMDLLK